MRYPMRLDIRLAMADYTALKALADSMDSTIGDTARYCLLRGIGAVNAANRRRRDREGRLLSERVAFLEGLRGDAEGRRKE